MILKTQSTIGFILLTLTAGCGVHLGDNFGRRNRTAFDAQAASRTNASTIDGEDAKKVLAVHRHGAGDEDQKPTAAASPFSSSSGKSSGPVMNTMSTSTSPIKLELK